MTSAYSLPNYRTIFSEYKNFDNIHGQLDIDNIAKLLKQLTRNAQRVPTTLRGGQLCYLALVISPADHNIIPTLAMFLRPVNPELFNLRQCIWSQGSQLH